MPLAVCFPVRLGMGKFANLCDANLETGTGAGRHSPILNMRVSRTAGINAPNANFKVMIEKNQDH